MANNYKGVGLVYTRVLYRKLNDDEQGRIRETLGPALSRMLEVTGASTWVPLREAFRIVEVVAPSAFPRSNEPLRELGRGMARHNLTKVYRAVFRVAGPRSILRIYRRLWGLYHREGEIALEEEGSQTLVVTEHSGLTESFCVSSAGWIEEALRLSGADRPWVRVDFSGGTTVRWQLGWA